MAERWQANGLDPLMICLARAGPGRGRLELRERTRPRPGPRQVLLKVAATGICGSDLHHLHGTLALAGDDYPQWLGHEYAGTVVEVGANVSGWERGELAAAEPSSGCGDCRYCRLGEENLCPRRRFHAGGFAPFVVVDEVRLHRLPAGLGLPEAALCEPAACAAHAVFERSGTLEGRLCLVIGPGPIGLLTALIAQSQGATVVLLGRASSSRRLALARELGVAHVLELEGAGQDGPGSTRQPLEALQQYGAAPGEGADIVYGCAGTQTAAATGLGLTRRGGRYLELALYGSPVEMDLDRVVAQEIAVCGVLGHRPSSWRLALELIGGDLLPAETLRRMITASFRLSQWERGFAAAGNRREMKVVLVP